MKDRRDPNPPPLDDAYPDNMEREAELRGGLNGDFNSLKRYFLKGADKLDK